MLKKGLAYHLSNDLVTVTDEPAAITDFVILCNKLDMKRRALQSKNKLANLNRSTFCSQTTTTTPSTVSYPAPASTTTSSGTASGPMDLSANHRRLSPEERTRRLAEGCCYRCSGTGHVARTYPLSQSRPLRSAEAAMLLAPAQEAPAQVQEPVQQPHF